MQEKNGDSAEFKDVLTMRGCLNLAESAKRMAIPPNFAV
jgi:hypothetical protein